MKYFLALISLLPAILLAKIEWEGSLDGGFSVKIALSTQKISIEDLLEITIQLNYPEDYKVDTDNLKINLLRNNGFGSPSCSLSSEKIEPQKRVGDKISQTIHYTLSPQLSGEHNLTFLNILFVKDQDSKVLFTPVFPIKVVFPSIDEELQGQIAPLLSFSQVLPIEIDSHNKRNLEASADVAEGNVIAIQLRSLLILFALILSAFACLLLFYLRWCASDKLFMRYK